MNHDPKLRLLMWDFDGTLGYRHGGAWSAALWEVLEGELPAMGATADHFRPYLQRGFLWHHPGRPHPEIRTAEQWWAHLVPVFEDAFQAVARDVGAAIGASEARALARQVRPTYTDPDRWRLFDDVLPTLDLLSARGLTHVLLTNHVPELREIVDHLGLTPRLRRIFNSAETGYEKPHPRAFQMVLETFPDAASVWMVGDNPEADVAGAEAVGIPALLVDRTGSEG